MAENLLGFGIFLFVSLIMIGIGISQVKSKEPVGFYTGEKPPKKEEISDVTSWNRKHGMIWIGYGVAMTVSYLVSLLIPQEFISFVFLLIVIIGALPVMIYYHHYLMRKYLKNQD